MKVRVPAWTLAMVVVIATVESIEDGPIARCGATVYPRIKLTWGSKGHTWTQIEHVGFLDLCETIDV